MEKKRNEMSITDVYVLAKVMENVKIAKRLMEQLTGQRIYDIEYPKEKIVRRHDGSQGIQMELHFCGEQRKVCRMQLFVCREDIFGRGRSVYHFVQTCVEEPELSMNAESIYVCPTEMAEEQKADKDIAALIDYIRNPQERKSNLVKMLDDEVVRIRSNPMFRKEYEAYTRKEMEYLQSEYARLHQRRKKHNSIM